jgi:putative transcriptional regulator
MHDGSRRGHRAVNTKVYLRLDRACGPPPPNPLIDPLAAVKRPLRSGDGPGDGRVEFTPTDVQHIRAAFLATQRQFARMIGIRYETLRNWETGRRRPQGPARALLRVVAANPSAVARALNWRLRAFKDPPAADMLDE